MTPQPAVLMPMTPPSAPEMPTNGTTPSNGHLPPNPARSRPPRSKPWSRTVKLLIFVAAVALLVPATVLGWFYYRLQARASHAELRFHTVKTETIQLTIVERGTLEAAENRDVICRVKAGSKGSTTSTTIRSVIEDGAQVKVGDLLVQLDDSGLQDQLNAQRITRDKARNEWLQAKSNYDIVKSQNDSDYQTAKTTLALAEMELKKYKGGDYEQQLKEITGRIKISESDLEMAQERAAWSDRMMKKKYITASQAQSDQSRLQSSQIAYARVQEELRVLTRFTDPRTLLDLESKIAEAKRGLARVETQTASKEEQAANDRDTKYLVYRQEHNRYEDIESEVRKCVIYAEQDGLVVYYISEQSRYGSGSQQSTIAQGEPVREGQKLMRIPNMAHMLVNTRVHESMVTHVRGDIYERTGYGDFRQAGLLCMPDLLPRVVGQNAFGAGRETFRDSTQQIVWEGFRDKELRLVKDGLPAKVRVDAFPGRLLKAHVKNVATVASQTDWMSSDVKVYQTMVSIDEPLEGLKPGMSAAVTIETDKKAENVLTIPVQCVVGSLDMGRTRKCFVKTPVGSIEERQIVVGLSNEKMVEVKEGLKDGDEVVMNPRALLSDKDKEQAQPTTPEKGGKGKADAGAGGEATPKGKGTRPSGGGVPPMDKK